MTSIAPASSPAYLRALAGKFRAQGTPTHIATADRLETIATDLERLLARDQQTGDTPRPPRDLTRGIDAKLAEMRRVPPPTPAELEAIRGLIGGKP